MRVLAEQDYIKYIDNILNETQNPINSFGNYELFVFDNIEEMHKKIKEKDKEFGLCRMIAGYAWPWNSKKDSTNYDIIINGSKFRWNSQNKDWINSLNALSEIGCIHTTQGYDINYAGIIIGNEISYENGEIKINPNNYYDKNGKKTIKDSKELKKYILNIYKTLLTRGIRGTYIYVCDDSLRNYFKKYIKTFNSDFNINYKEIDTSKPSTINK